MKIQEYINNREKYRVDKTYQRAANAWSPEDKQCLIDTILCGEPMPIFFLNLVNDVFYVVDGQQRLNCIAQFYDNKIKLSGKFSGNEKAGKTFGGDNPLNDSDKQKFLNYDLKFHILDDYDDIKVRLIFSRLQRGKPLSLGERLNAMPGQIVNCMRLLADHPFMNQSTAISKNRYGLYPDIARILLYAKCGARDSGSKSLYTFFEQERNMDKNSVEYRRIITVLNHLERCFPTAPGNYRHLEKHTWVLAVFTMIDELVYKKSYTLVGQYENIGTFIKKFHSKVYNEDHRKSYANTQRFYDHVRGGWSEKLIALRRDILVEELLAKHQLWQLDRRRQISDADKIALFAEHPTCEQCGIIFKDYKEAEYHHIVRYVDGGKTHKENIMVLCKDCHRNLP